MNEKVKELMNMQVNYELEAAYLYLEFSNFFDSRNLEGYANYYKVQAKEEIDHAMLIYDYLHDINENVKLMIIHAPLDEYKSIEEVLDAGLKAEEDVTSKINKIYDCADKYSDTASKVFIKWFITEQVEEETNARKMIDDYKMFKDNLFMLDQKYANRKYSKPNIQED